MCGPNSRYPWSPNCQFCVNSPSYPGIENLDLDDDDDQIEEFSLGPPLLTWENKTLCPPGCIFCEKNEAHSPPSWYVDKLKSVAPPSLPVNGGDNKHSADCRWLCGLGCPDCLERNSRPIDDDESSDDCPRAYNCVGCLENTQNSQNTLQSPTFPRNGGEWRGPIELPKPQSRSTLQIAHDSLQSVVETAGKAVEAVWFPIHRVLNCSVGGCEKCGRNKEKKD
jgi:hypothetical protein